jgi:ABC-type sugar transport system ATPase subunit
VVESAPRSNGDGPEVRPVAVRLTDVGKRFGATVALADVSVEVQAGNIHAFVGQNGAGKSTCLALLAGRLPADSGRVEVFGDPLPQGQPKASRAAGVAAIYQELTIVPALTAQANVFLGQEIHHAGLYDEAQMRRRFLELRDRLRVNIAPDVQARSLSVADQQLLEIMRALVADPRVILFDEPTAALALHEREALYRVIRELRDNGTTIVFVSHNLDEILDLADHVTVFRSGRVTSAGPAGSWTKEELVHAMVGREIERAADEVAGTRTDQASAPALRVRGLHAGPRLREVSLEVWPGELLGIGGLVGSGRSTLLRALAGDISGSSGELWVRGEHRPWPGSVRQARKHGVVMVPEDRKTAGLLPHMSAAENIVLSDLGSTARLGGLVSRRRTVAAAERVATGMGFARDRLTDSAGNLSGGNQQKLMLARAAHARPVVLLADEPMRGVDVGAKAEIMRTLRRLAEAGMAVITVSSELEDLEVLCDRVVVMSHGEIVGEIVDPRDISVGSILQLAFKLEDPS